MSALKDDGTAWALGAVGALGAALLLHRRQQRANTPVDVGIHFPGVDDEQLEHLFRAQDQLHKAGVNFDTGFGMVSRTRDWEFDWSLEGPARVTFRRFRR